MHNYCRCCWPFGEIVLWQCFVGLILKTNFRAVHLIETCPVLNKVSTPRCIKTFCTRKKGQYWCTLSNCNIIPDRQILLVYRMKWCYTKLEHINATFLLKPNIMLSSNYVNLSMTLDTECYTAECHIFHCYADAE